MSKEKPYLASAILKYVYHRLFSFETGYSPDLTVCTHWVHVQHFDWPLLKIGLVEEFGLYLARMTSLLFLVVSTLVLY